MRRAIPALAAAAALAAATAPAHAFELAVPKAGPADARAGQHSDVQLRIEPKDGQVRDLDIHFPPGLVGNPNATDRCTHAQFEASACPAATQVGSSTTEATLLGLPQKLQGQIYNLQPRGSEPARLGIVIRPPAGSPIRLESPVEARQSDGGLDSTLRDIPNSFGGAPITITALDVTLAGTAPTGRPFMQNPTSCGRAETVVEARSYGDERAQGRAAFESTACRELPFAPAFEAAVGAPGETAQLSNPPLTTVVAQTAGQANVKRVAVTLPRDIGVAADRIGRACPEAEFAEFRCAPTAEIGVTTAITPLLSAPLQGPVTFVTGQALLPEVVLSLRGPLSLTLRGRNELTPAGQVTTFDGIPDVPLSRFELRFHGGDAGLLAASRDLCTGAPPQLSATFTSHAGTESTVQAPARIDGCTGAAAPPRARPGFRTTLRLGSLRRGRPSLRLRVEGTGGAIVRRVRLNLARGLRVDRRTRLTGARVRSRRRAIEVPARRGGTRTVALTLGSGTIAVAPRQRGAKRLRFTVVITDTRGRRITRRVTVRPRG